MAAQTTGGPRALSGTGDWSFLWGYLRRQRARLVLLGAVLLAATALQLAAPLLLRRFIDIVSAGTADVGTSWLAAGFVAASLVAQGLTAVETAIAESVAWRSTNQLRLDTLRHCIGLDMAFHHSHSPGELVERVDGDVSMLSNLFSRFAVAVASQVLLVVGVIGALLVIEWRIGLLLAALIGAGLTVLRKVTGLGRRAFVAYREAVARLTGFTEERLSATEDLQANGAVGHTLRRFAEVNRPLRRREMTAAVLGSALVWGSSSVIISVATAAVLFVAATLTGSQAMTLGTVYLVFAYVQALQAPLIALSWQLQDYQRALAGLTRVRRILAVAPEPPGRGRPLPGSGALAVRFDGVRFGYRTDAVVLDDVGFELPPGASLGVVGHTGSGKTTIARLLVGLYHPQRGTVRVGDVATGDAELTQLRDRVALVTQDVHLIAGTVRDNVTLFDPGIPDTAVRAAVDRLGLGEWLAGLPDGLDTVVGDHRRGLSAGQAQLLALTRVFLRRPGLVLLDEASARLDPVTERLLDTAIGRLIADRTAVVIAHRLATLRWVDRVLVLDAGRVVEHGPRAVLADDPGSRFHALLQAAK